VRTLTGQKKKVAVPADNGSENQWKLSYSGGKKVVSTAAIVHPNPMTKSI
jgi:hypothetical protein